MKLKNMNIPELMEHYHVPGLSIALIEKAQISERGDYGVLQIGDAKSVTENSIFNACSISKFLTGMVVIKLTEQGLLDLDEDVNIKLESWKLPKNEYSKKVTLRNLLSHQSGFLDPKQSFTELKSSLGAPSMLDVLEGKTPYCKEPIRVKYEPESKFHYSDAGFCIIQQLIEDVTKKTFKQVANELLFKPLKMKNSLFITEISDVGNEDFSSGHNKNGEVVAGNYPIYPYPAASGLWTTTTDLARLVIELMNALKGESIVSISASKAKEMIGPQRDMKWCGLGVFLEGAGTELEVSSLGWGVGFQSMLVAFPNKETGSVIMTNAELGVHQMEGIIGEIYKSLEL
ncbi:class A beta-lactamase-related serine hydrolase [Bacillus timonensis]|uniref:Class A beta-lactamase-related serine hydrolase n=1 Tax=Bacillus timonensis TaxID=1033734 RepID=A0A4V3V7Y1_9BACI|nr:serine hydrolase domain-containing protein [Bacillus timonensis]THE13043.1 class A beta-lactamase-related serine hydrolase [Bacillus timonensis]